MRGKTKFTCSFVRNRSNSSKRESTKKHWIFSCMKIVMLPSMKSFEQQPLDLLQPHWLMMIWMKNERAIRPIQHQATVDLRENVKSMEHLFACACVRVFRYFFSYSYSHLRFYLVKYVFACLSLFNIRTLKCFILFFFQ